VDTDFGHDDAMDVGGAAGVASGDDPTVSPDAGPDAGSIDPPGEHVEMENGSTHYDAGVLGADVDGDGHPDSAVIRTPKQIEYYTDTDGDGRADELTITTPDGHLISHTELDPRTGVFHETPYHAQAPEAVTHPPERHVEMDVHGHQYDAGAVDLDSDGDGRPDTAVIVAPHQIEYYTDADGDGKADELTITTPDGHLISHTEREPGTSTWVETPLDHELPDR